MFADHHNVAHGVDVYLRTWAMRDQAWVEVLSAAAADEIRNLWSADRDVATRVQCVLTAFDNSLHVVMDDGRVAAFDGRQWVERAAGNPKMKLHFPQAAFDGSRIVLWGSGNKSGVLKNESWFFDGSSWKKGAKQLEVPGTTMARLTMHDGKLHRLTGTALSVLEGEVFRVLTTWTTPFVGRRNDALVSVGSALQYIEWEDGNVWAVSSSGEPNKIDDVVLDARKEWFIWREQGAWRLCEKDTVYGID